ncbi:MAG TPA: Gfo/Idh/MocA family oxidoreductase [Candidatus Brocadiia bacterium]|nr:Gfo/Idh/MocA family oxidoreductase [Candidatus Brocadiia bacterium]
MARMALVGLGGMGNMHLGIYNKLDGAEVVAVFDIDPEKLKLGQSKQEINLGTGGGVLDPKKTKVYTDFDKMLADPGIDAVDICTPTPVHKDCAVKALNAGKHVICEKPMGRTPADAMAMVEAAEKTGRTLMIAQCIRFWPDYVHLKQTLDSGRLGRLISLEMWRFSGPPRWGWQNWFLKGDMSGGALLDFHVHDVDFVVSLFGKPESVSSQGVKGPSSEIDAVVTQYNYGLDKIVTTTGNWCLGGGFHMAYLAVFEKGHIRYDSRFSPALVEVTQDGEKTPEILPGDGYLHEITYFIECINKGQAPARCMPRSSAMSIQVADAERRSALSGRPEKV